MKVITLKRGYFGKLREPDDTFDVPEGEKASWFTPVDAPATAKRGNGKPAAADKTASEDLV